MSSPIRHTLIIALFSVACLAGNLGAAEPANSDAVAATYGKVATAKAKAEVAMKALAPLADNRLNGIEQARMQTENATRKIFDLFDVRMRTEEQRGESRDQVNLDNLRKSRSDIEAKSRESEPARRAIDAKANALSDTGSRLRDLMSVMENVERQLKVTDLDVAPAITIYTDIEAKALALTAEATATINEANTMAMDWSGVLKANE